MSRNFTLGTANSYAVTLCKRSNNVALPQDTKKTKVRRVAPTSDHATTKDNENHSIMLPMCSHNSSISGLRDHIKKRS